MVRLRLPVARLWETALPRLGESAPLSRATVGLLLARHLVLRHRLVHRRLALLRLVLRRGVALRVDAVHLVGAALHAVVLRVVDLRGEAHHAARWSRVGTWTRVGKRTWFSWWTRFHVDDYCDACCHQVSFSHTQRKDSPRAPSDLIRVYREGGVSRRCP